MNSTSDAPLGLAFGRFRVLPEHRELLADGRPVKLGGQAFDVQMTLIEAQGAVVPARAGTTHGSLGGSALSSFITVCQPREVYSNLLVTAYASDGVRERVLSAGVPYGGRSARSRALGAHHAPLTHEV